MHTLLLAIPLGLVIGISLGALGGGGSILTVPALVYVIGESAGTATTGSLVIVGVTALTGTVGHARAGRVRWARGLIFGVVGIGGSLLGSLLNKLVNANVLLLAFAGLMLAAAAAMLHRQASSQREPGRAAADAPADTRLSPARVIAVAIAGTIVGFMTGFFGVGGGFVVVPALVLALGVRMGRRSGPACWSSVSTPSRHWRLAPDRPPSTGQSCFRSRWPRWWGPCSATVSPAGFPERYSPAHLRHSSWCSPCM